MTPRLRKFALTAHVTFSVGWLGAVAGFIALAVAGLINQDAQLLHMQPISYLASVAAKTTLSGADLHVQIQLVVVAGTALLALLVATTLSVYKPRGLTRYGWRKQQQQRKVQ